MKRAATDTKALIAAGYAIREHTEVSARAAVATACALEAICVFQ